MTHQREEFYRLHNGDAAKLPFSDAEYKVRLAELREDIDTVLEPGMVIAMEPMLTIPEGQAGAGGYREHDILVVGPDGAENITKYPYGPAFNVV